MARMTIYHQFGSKIGLLEALCDSLAVTGEMEQLASAFRCPEPSEGLDEYIRIFGRFWQADRLVTRRLRGLATLDPDFEQVIRARDEQRRKGLRVLVQRIVEEISFDCECFLFCSVFFESRCAFRGHLQADISPDDAQMRVVIQLSKKSPQA